LSRKPTSRRRPPFTHWPGPQPNAPGCGGASSRFFLSPIQACAGGRWRLSPPIEWMGPEGGFSSTAR
jgi:hypothetical protein